MPQAILKVLHLQAGVRLPDSTSKTVGGLQRASAISNTMSDGHGKISKPVLVRVPGILMVERSALIAHMYSEACLQYPDKYDDACLLCSLHTAGAGLQAWQAGMQTCMGAANSTLPHALPYGKAHHASGLSWAELCESRCDAAMSAIKHTLLQ